jgi:hypothetical protein
VTLELVDAFPNLSGLQQLYLNVYLIMQPDEPRAHSWTVNWIEDISLLSSQRKLLELALPQLIELELNIDHQSDGHFQAEILNVLADSLVGNTSLSSLKLTNNNATCGLYYRPPLNIVDDTLKKLTMAIASCSALKKVALEMPLLESDGGLVYSLIGNSQLELVELHISEKLLRSIYNRNGDTMPSFEIGAKMISLTTSDDVKRMVDILFAITPNLSEFKIGRNRGSLKWLKGLIYTLTSLMGDQGRSLRFLDLADIWIEVCRYGSINLEDEGNSMYKGSHLNCMLMRLISLIIANPQLTIRLPPTISEDCFLLKTMAIFCTRNDVKEMWGSLSSVDRARLYTDNNYTATELEIEHFKMRYTLGFNCPSDI